MGRRLHPALRPRLRGFPHAEKNHQGIRQVVRQARRIRRPPISLRTGTSPAVVAWAARRRRTRPFPAPPGPARPLVSPTHLPIIDTCGVIVITSLRNERSFYLRKSRLASSNLYNSHEEGESARGSVAKTSAFWRGTAREFRLLASKQSHKSGAL